MTQTWLSDAIDKLQDIARDEIKEKQIGNHLYLSQTMHRIDPPEGTPPRFLEFSTLTGIMDYLKSGECALIGSDTPMIHIEDSQCVRIVSEGLLLPDNRRYTYAESRNKRPSFAFGQWQDNERFIINLLSQFVQDGNTELLTSALGNLASTKTVEHVDDGFSQSLEVKSGILTKEGVTIQNPILLRPYRTFLEVKQPTSECIYRNRESDAASLDCVLFVADGVMWELEAVTSIRNWFMTNCPGVPVLA